MSEPFLLSSLVTAVIVAFYFVLAVRWQLVRRPMLYLIGVGGVLLMMIALFFGLGSSLAAAKVMMVLQIIGLIVAFKCAVCACYGGKLPIWDDMFGPKAGPPAA